MRRLILVLVLTLLAAMTTAGSASAAPIKDCNNVKAMINGKKYVLAIKVTTRGLSCGATAEFWKAFATGGQGSATTEDLRQNCKQGSKASQKAAAKKGRTSDVCRSSNGKILTKAWVLGG